VSRLRIREPSRFFRLLLGAYRTRRLAAPAWQVQATMNNGLQSFKKGGLATEDSVAVVTHELRGPLACIRTAVQCLRLKRPADPDVERTYGLIERQVDLMTRLVNDLLDVVRVGRGKLRVERRLVELADIVQGAIDMSRPLIEARRHSLTVALSPTPVRLSADAVRLTQVVANLLSNAAKYTPEGGHIWLEFARDGTEVVLSVRDDGIGISREMLPRVFEPFVQGDSASRLAEGGLGIGLTVAKGLVEMHGGRIQAFSLGQGKGSEFIVRLPTAGATEQVGSAASPEPYRRRRILVVDDHADAANVLAEWLRTRGHDVEAAHDGQEAVAMARVFSPDVVLLDLQLAGAMDGYDVAWQLRREPSLEGVQLVALSGFDREDCPEDRHAIFDAHLVKPVNVVALHSLLTEEPCSGLRSGHAAHAQARNERTCSRTGATGTAACPPSHPTR
jgi:signal transduction histidine kinase